MPRHKRPRGGQPGNQNARKHGFYSHTLSLQEMNDLYNTLSQGGKDPGLAVIRMKLNFIFRNAPGNPRLIREVAGLLYKWLRSQPGVDRLNRENKAELRQFMRNFKIAIVNNTLPELIESKS